MTTPKSTATKATKSNKHEKSQKFTNNINKPNKTKTTTTTVVASEQHDSTPPSSSNLVNNYCNNLYEIDANQSRVSCGSLSLHKQALQRQQFLATTPNRAGAATNQSQQLRNPSSVSFSGVSTNGSSSDQNCYNSNPTTSLINNSSSSNILTKSSLKSNLSAANLAKIEQQQKQIAAVAQLTTSTSGMMMIKPPSTVTEVYDQLREVEQQVFFRKKLDGRGSQQHLMLHHPSQIALASNADRHFQIKDKYVSSIAHFEPKYSVWKFFLSFQMQLCLHHFFPLRPLGHATLEHLPHSHWCKPPPWLLSDSIPRHALDPLCIGQFFVNYKLNTPISQDSYYQKNFQFCMSLIWHITFLFMSVFNLFNCDR